MLPFNFFDIYTNHLASKYLILVQSVLKLLRSNANPRHL